METDNKSNRNYKNILNKAYKIISIVSTLTIFSMLILFIFGKINNKTLSDDYLLMDSIKKQMPDNLIITDIIKEDIHGFGNESMIVLATDRDKSNVANQILIYDQIDNDILNKVYNFYGYGSNYVLSYKFSECDLDNENPDFGYDLKIMDFVDLTGDLSKEIIVKIEALPSGTGQYYNIGIFSYSYDTGKYYLIGTFPSSECELQKGDSIKTVFKENDRYYNYYNKNEKFDLERGSGDDNDFFIVGKYQVYLVRTLMIWDKNECHVDPHRHKISVFVPEYEVKTNTLKWKIIFYKETDEYLRYCDSQYVESLLSEWNVIY